MTVTTDRKRKSEKLLAEELKAFGEAVRKFSTKIDAAEFFGFSTVTLDNILLRGSGKPETVKGIREKLEWLKKHPEAL